jgi:2-oxoglutarate ferredoxin oxidoreductase subunit delta
MAKIVINTDRCKSCMLCVTVCPRGLIRQSNELNKRGMYPVARTKSKSKDGCTGCALCALMCPDVCIEVYK